MTKKDLMKFCLQDDLYSKEVTSTYDKPWTRDGFTFATNGRFLIRVPALSDVSDNEKALDTLRVFPNDQPAQWFDIPETDDGMRPCWMCDGKGTYYRKKCEECDGEKTQIDTTKNTKIGGVKYANHYLHFLRMNLPGVKIGPMQFKNEGKHWSDYVPAWIKFDGGDGVLMPVRV